MLNLFDVTHSIESPLSNKPRQANDREVSAYAQWLRQRRGLPEMARVELHYTENRQGRRYERGHCIGATFGDYTSNGSQRTYENGAYSIVMPGHDMHRAAVTFDMLDDSGEVERSQTLPAEPKKGGVIWSREDVRKAHGPVAKPGKVKRGKVEADPIPVHAEAPSADPVEFSAPAAAESEEAPIVAQKGGEALNALSGPEIAPEEVEADSVADLAERVAALEARLEALAVETGRAPIPAKRREKSRKAYRLAAHLYMNVGQERRWRAGPALTERTIERMDSMAAKPLPDQALLLKLLRYEPETGELFWRERTPDLFASGNTSKEANCRAWNRRYAGKTAFKHLDTHKYRCGRLLDRMALAHRVIWKMMTGDEAVQVDHINGVRTDNRWCNLRSVSRSDNCRNTKIYSNNNSGVSGVHWNSAQRKWIARIHGRNPIYLGVFATKDDAVRARKAAEREHGFHPNHGRKQSA